MLPPELSQLIKIAASDGVITPAEKEVLLKKATSLGANLDEVKAALAAYEKPTDEQTSALQSLQNKLKDLAKQQSTALLTIIDYAERSRFQGTCQKEQEGLIISHPLPETEKELRDFYKYCLKQKDIDKDPFIRTVWEKKSIECFSDLLAHLADNLDASLELILEAKEQGNEKLISKTPRARKILETQQKKAEKAYQAARKNFFLEGWGWRRILTITTIVITIPAIFIVKFYSKEKDAFLAPIIVCLMILIAIFISCVSKLESIKENIDEEYKISDEKDN